MGMERKLYGDRWGWNGSFVGMEVKLVGDGWGWKPRLQGWDLDWIE